MEEVMRGIYNYLFDAKNELGIEDIKLYQNLEGDYVVNYKKDIKTKQIVDDYLEHSDDVLIKVLKSPTATNAKIYDGKIDIDLSFEILAEVLGETKMQVSIFKSDNDKDEDEFDDLDIEVNEDFLNTSKPN